MKFLCIPKCVVLCWVFFLFQINFSQAQFESAYQYDYPLRYYKLDSIYGADLNKIKDYQQQINLLSEFQKIALANNDKIAIRFYKLHLFNIKRNFKNLSENEIENFTIPFLLFCDKEANYDLKFSALMNLGYYYREKEKFGKALFYFLKAVETDKNLPSTTAHYRTDEFVSMANTLYKFGKYNTTIQLCKAAIAHTPRPIDRLFINDLISSSYYKSGNYESALIYLDSTQISAKAAINSPGIKSWNGIVLGNRGKILARQNKIKKAIGFLKMGIDSTLKYNLSDNVSSFSTELIKIYFNQNEKEEIMQLLPIALASTNKAGGANDKATLFQTLKLYYQNNGDTKLALQYADSAAIWKENAELLFGKNTGVLAELDFEKDKAITNDLFLKNEIKQQRFYQWGAIAGCILLLLIGILIYNRQRLKHKLKEQFFATEKINTENELNLATLKLNEFAEIVSEKNKLIETMETQTNNEVSDEIIEKLKTTILLTDDQWKEFRILFEQVHKGFIAKLNLKFPDLSPAETRLMVLAKLNLSAKEMGMMLGVSANAVRNTWYRIRKKYNLSEDAILEIEVKSI
ncbi:MAG: hypothetical protein RIQ33_197 [Bacteroidota bacterium]|jgi:hypothetical protein